MKITRILHASVNVEDRLEPTAAFYAAVLDLDQAPRPVIPGIAGQWFSVGDAQLHLVDAPHRGAPRIDPTGPHICFGVEDFDAAVTELDGAAIPYERAQQGSVPQVWITDPSGFTIELQPDPRPA
jgi:catechol 2,3-dioxygenase-like lactoylglutathione lyase family enzyme